MDNIKHYITTNIGSVMVYDHDYAVGSGGDWQFTSLPSSCPAAFAVALAFALPCRVRIIGLCKLLLSAKAGLRRR